MKVILFSWEGMLLKPINIINYPFSFSYVVTSKPKNWWLTIKEQKGMSWTLWLLLATYFVRFFVLLFKILKQYQILYSLCYLHFVCIYNMQLPLQLTENHLWLLLLARNILNQVLGCRYRGGAEVTNQCQLVSHMQVWWVLVIKYPYRIQK